jgi:hypothetical protein
MPSLRFTFGFAFVSFLLAITGCKQEGPTIVKVSGTLLIKGQPVQGVKIYFTPTKGRQSSTESEKDGKFSVVYSRGTDGMLLSDYQVWIEHTYTQSEREGFTEGLEKPSAEVLAICQKYGSPATGMKITITGPNNDLKLNFE